MEKAELDIQIQIIPVAPSLAHTTAVDVDSISPDSDLPPMDGGFHALAYLASSWLVELLTWSYPFSYGVFLEHYKTHVFPDAPSSVLALVGSMSTGIIYLTSWLILPLIARYPTLKKPMMSMGVVFCVGGLMGAAFANQPWQLVLTQGVIYALGGSFLYFPVMTYLFEWFSERKGLANGIIFSGTGVGGVVVPLIVEVLLRKYGHRVTLLSLAIAFAVLIIPAFPYIKSRHPQSASRTAAPPAIDISFVKSSAFWILFFANLAQGLPTYIPALYLPTFAADLGLDAAAGSATLSMLNGASVPGLIFLGWLSDHYDLRISMLVSTLGSALAVFLLWGLSTNLPVLLIFAFVYGAIGPSWSALWPRFITSIIGDDPRMSSLVLTVFIGGRGVGNVASGPVSTALMCRWALTDKTPFGYGLNGYGPLILFTGSMLLLSTAGVTYRSFQRVAGVVAV
ncbi:major facilitator superfamily domain-containing protein [Mycena rosella]|uniref:Major facilitator superfamily domain-containing protein n=1 Tax=Mycena rosella TaxID=1033263 RepID=A0AAD7CWK3_MYCRO|nr:major facilitator superfamily domain-containing protein [Mycena rosella]